MALSVKHLNSDASFLLSFEPVYSDPSTGSVVIPQPFTILLDPWITGPSKIVHPRFSITTHKISPCVSSLAQLPEPDLVIISQHKSDHCNEATLRQLPASGTKTIILAEPASARLIKSWKYFDRDKIRTIEPWKDPRVSGKSNVIRIPVPSVMPGAQKGEVTVSWVPQKRDIAGLHGAIGITYRAPFTHSLPKLAILPPLSDELTPPATPVSMDIPTSILRTPSTTGIHLVPPSPPMSPRSLRSVHSTATFSPTHSVQLSPAGSKSNCRCSLRRSLTTTSFTQQGSRPISVLFSPHGISYTNIAPWATSHLVSEAALPLTALLHCMDSISNPWWLGGNICSGTLTGAEIANNLGARVWISAHDAEKNVKGFATGLLRTRRWEREEIVEIVSPKFKDEIDGDEFKEKKGRRKSSLGLGLGMDKGTEVLRLQAGEDVLVTGEGMVFAASFTGY